MVQNTSATGCGAQGQFDAKQAKFYSYRSEDCSGSGLDTRHASTDGYIKSTMRLELDGMGDIRIEGRRQAPGMGKNNQTKRMESPGQQDGSP